MARVNVALAADGARALLDALSCGALVWSGADGLEGVLVGVQADWPVLRFAPGTLPRTAHRAAAVFTADDVPSYASARAVSVRGRLVVDDDVTELHAEELSGFDFAAAAADNGRKS